MSADVLTLEYRNRFDGLEDYRDRVWQVLTGDFFSRYIAADDCVLDLGAGWGEFIRHIDCGQRLAMDLNPDTRAKLPSDVRVLLQDCSEPWEIDAESLDVVFTSNFFEHLPDKPALERTVQQALRCLKPGGRLLCLGPNMRYLGGTYWEFWDHHVALTDRSLAELLRLVGFEIEERIARFLPYSMSQGFTPPLVLLRAYLKLRPAWPLFGKQFFVVARKPAPAAPHQRPE